MTLALDWDAYKRLCDTPNVLSRWMLEQTAELVHGHLRAELKAALDLAPLSKPQDHKGGPATDMFQLDLARRDVLAVHEQIANAVANGETSSATGARGLGGFEEAWREYADYLNTTDVL